jgi:hypothetical protein
VSVEDERRDEEQPAEELVTWPFPLP